MGVNYSALAVKAKSLIGSNGAKCILVNPIEGVGTYNTKQKNTIKMIKGLMASVLLPVMRIDLLTVLL